MFIFNGISSTEMSISCENEDFVGRASKKYEETSIEGMNGSSFEELGYSNYEKSVTMYLKDPEKIDDVLLWLDGKGIFEYQDRKTTAWFLDEIQTENKFDKIIILKTKFIRYPIWEPSSEKYISVSDKIYNFGNVTSYPIIKLEGSGNVDLTINDVRFIYHFDEDKTVEIDCLNMNETFNGISKSKNIEIDFKYPKLKPGANNVVVHSGKCDIYVKRKDAWV